VGASRRFAVFLAAGLAAIGGTPVTPASAAGTFTMFAVPAEVTGPASITFGLDGNLWFTDVGGNIVRMSTAGSSTVFQVPSQAAGGFPFPVDITHGADGNLWFDEANGGNIGRVTRAGAITEFPIPGGDWFSGIAPGWDGNIWFGSRTTGVVGRITPLGDYTGFTIPPADGTHDPVGATIGPGRSVWISDESANVIWQVDRSGTMTPHPLPAPNRGPAAITVGWDGNLWFTELGLAGAAIGRLTPSGVYTEFPVSNTPVAITPGLDGKLWFTEIFGGKVGSISMNGHVTELDVPAQNPVLHGITTGPDGNIWFTDASNLGVWRLTIPHRFNRLPGGQPVFAGG
jgi:virginiamycin B lyase